jgi:Zn-finger nucleic acid-binding protein
MTRMNFGRRSGIIIDACRAHGVWFDRGELDAILEFVRLGGIESELAKAAVGEALSAEAVDAIRELDGAMRADVARVREVAWKTRNFLLLIAQPNRLARVIPS